MPISVQCPSCHTALRVPDQHAGKRVKCPKCGQAVAVPAAQAAAVAAGTSPTAPPPAPAGGASGPVVVSCPGCGRTLRARAELAGKTVKCPGCGKGVKVPQAVAPAADEEGWIDVNEAADPAEVAAALARSSPPTGDWGQELMDEHEVPEEIQDEMHAALTRDERLTWFARPRMDILLERARSFRMRLLLVGLLLAVVFPTVGVLLIYFRPGGGAGGIIGGIIAVLFGVGGVALAVWGLGMPGRVERGAANRACYALTRRRLLVHPGKGRQLVFSPGSASITSTSGGGVISYVGSELTRMSRIELDDFPGCGDLILRRNLFDDPYGDALWAIDEVRDVEKAIRQRLVHPVIDKLLRGDPLTREEKAGVGKQESGQGQEILPPDENIKDFAGGDANVRQAPGLRGEDVPEEVAEELTEGERALWVGEPEGSARGRGVFGALAGSAERREPDYYLYAITNRRVLLFCEKGTRLESPPPDMPRIVVGRRQKRGPVCYYPDQLRTVGVESDRAAKVGDLVFRKVKYVIRITTEFKERPGAGPRRGPSRNQTRVETRTQIHHFGLLRIRNPRGVARLLYDALIAPCRGL
jgi:predicted Zn finger-like uncharacterized protein